MKKIIFLLVFFVVTFSIDLFAQSWQLVWSDEFDSTEIDQSIWTREVGGDGWGNNELQYYTDRPENSYLENGKLIIKAMKENLGGRNYTSARIKSQDKKFFTYGKMEARIKLPFGKGLWPAFWMLGQSFPVVGWPACGEIDVMEMVGGPGGDNKVYGTAHWKANGQHQQNGGDYTLGSGIFADDFHIFTIIWNEQLIQWYVDDHLYHVLNITPADLSELRKDFFFILNVAVGGDWPGPPDPSTIFPQKMEVDYIRVYEYSPTAVVNEKVEPTNFYLSQNYPNPFNPSTKINYGILQDSFVKIKVYNLLGIPVASLVNEEQQPGNYSIEFNTVSLPSGVYFYNIRAGRYSKTRQMVLIK